jgi:membrane protein DedA with SNARE-associated domain
MEETAAFVARWQGWIYPALALYAAVKSGLLPLFAAAMAGAGLLHPFGVFAALLIGTVLGEEAKFHAGRWVGPRSAARWPRLGAPLARTAALFARWGAAWVLLYRWPKGGRTIGALPLGAAGWRWHRFAPLNLLGGLLWAGGIAALGLMGGAGLIAGLERWGAAATAALLAPLLFGLVLAWRATRPRMIP